MIIIDEHFLATLNIYISRDLPEDNVYIELCQWKNKTSLRED